MLSTLRIMAFALRELTMNRLLERLRTALQELDLGISRSAYESDLVSNANKALRQVGSPPLKDLGDASSVLRAVNHLESEV